VSVRRAAAPIAHEQNSFAYSIARHSKALRFEPGKNFRDRGETGDNDVGARSVEPGHLLALDRRERREIVDDMLELNALHDSAVNRSRGSNGVTRQNHPGEIGERSSGADHLRATPVASGEFIPERLSHATAQLSHGARSDSFREIFFCQPDRAEGNRYQSLYQAVCTEHQLE
jgi:hypothetical protein